MLNVIPIGIHKFRILCTFIKFLCEKSLLAYASLI